MYKNIQNSQQEMSIYGGNMSKSVSMNPSRLVQYLQKPAEEFTKTDLIKFIKENNIEIVNFRYVGGDGNLKTLNFVINSEEHLDQLLAIGERVDGSSLFTYVDAASSDLYVIPRYKTAFVNPFSSIPAVDILCSYYTYEGEPLPSAPENILRKAQQVLKRKTGMTLEALGELEYYIIHEPDSDFYPISSQKGYQESSPFCKFEKLRCEIMQAVAQAGGKIKYGHSEVGNISDGNRKMEQHEVEFLPTQLEDAADQLAIAKWMIRMLGQKYGVSITFAPKIIVGHAGSGLHIHTRLIKNRKNMLVKNGKLSDIAKKVIAGYLDLASSLTAFGNTVPTSYLRLVPHQEAPTNICWGERNRSALIRVPLGWLGKYDMARKVNPQSKEEIPKFIEKQTIEIRSADGSANVYLLLAGIVVAARHGLEMEDSLKLAEKLRVNVNIFSPEYEKLQEKLPHLPSSCWESAEVLLKDRETYQAYNVFPAGAIDDIAKKLRDYDDKNLSEKLYGKKEELEKLVKKYLHC